MKDLQEVLNEKLSITEGAGFFNVGQDGDGKACAVADIGMFGKWKHMFVSYDDMSGTVLVTGYNKIEELADYYGTDVDAWEHIEKAKPNTIVRDKSSGTYSYVIY